VIFIRIFRWLVLACVAAGLVLYLQPMNLNSSNLPESATLTVSAKDLQLTCPGAAIVAGGSTGTSTSTFSRKGSALVSLSYSGATQTSLVATNSTKTQGFGVRQDLKSRIANSASVKVLDASGKTEQGSALLTANQIQLSTDTAIRGLLGAPCLRPQSEFWLVGGTTSVGRESLLVLTNPTAVDATADLTIYTENGLSHSAGLTGVSVPKYSTTVLPLSSFVLRAESLTVHVESFGGSITAFIQQKAVRGTSANGADFISPSSGASKESVFPGILVRGSKDSAKFRQESTKYSDVYNLLRITNPSNTEANITFQVLGTNSQTFGTVLSVKAPAGKVTDFEISGLEDGDYFGVLNSDVEVYSSVRLVRAKATGSKYIDFAWINPAEKFESRRYIAVPSSGISKLSIVNPGSQPATVELKIGSALVKRSISAAGAEVIRVAPGLSVGIYSDKPIQANLIVDVDGRIAQLPVLDEKNISGEVSISIH